MSLSSVAMQSMQVALREGFPRVNGNYLSLPPTGGETPTFIEHIKAGLDALESSKDAVLVFSGGRTKQHLTDLSEAQSYYNLAKENNFFSKNALTGRIIITETHATDSYQNVLFSILRFRLYTGAYPSRMTIITHEFKRERFLKIHLPAIGWVPRTQEEPSDGLDDRARLIGINPPPEITSPESLVEGELKRGIGLWAKDRYGVGGDLGEKRRKRGWEGPGVFVGKGLEPVVERLVLWDGGEGGEGGNELFPMMEGLPWYFGKGDHERGEC
ncbi:hypothetical protein FQN54_002661 [Arachnomyces sp. PD_36]|nr:hypothetical protein FQN54_002661 [Arachnomyces sp. PD_36]